MILNWKALRKGVVVAAVVALISSLLVASVSAQPPTPPNRFFGNVAGASAGASVTATIGGNVCGQTTVQADSTYVLDAVSSGQTAGCATEGASVEFAVNGAPAGTATWSSGKFTELDLTAGVAPPPPSVVPTTVVPTTPTPVIVTGTGGYLDGGSGTAWWAYTAAGLALLLLGTAGVAAYRRYPR